MHEPPAATADMAVLPGVLGARTLRRTDKYASGPSPCGCPVARPSPRSRHGVSCIMPVGQRFPCHHLQNPLHRCHCGLRPLVRANTLRRGRVICLRRPWGWGAKTPLALQAEWSPKQSASEPLPSLRCKECLPGFPPHRCRKTRPHPILSMKRLCAFAEEITPPRAAAPRICLSTTICLYLSPLSAKQRESQSAPTLSQHLVHGASRYSHGLPIQPGRYRDSPGWRSVSRPHASSDLSRPVQRLRPHLPGVKKGLPEHPCQMLGTGRTFRRRAASRFRLDPPCHE
jgi:hypothetical protein